MSEETIVKKRKRDTEIASRPEQKKKRVECNKKNRELKKAGVSTAGKDVSHTKRGLVLKSTKANRGSKSDSAGDRRARGGKTKK